MTDVTSNPKQRIGIFGGSFNPPHVAHLLVAEHIREQFDLDKVIWIPGYVPPHKQDEQLASAADRFAMVELAIKSNPGFEVSDIEIQREGISFTVDTLVQISNDSGDAELFLIIGGDSYAAFDNWYNPERIVELATLIVYERGDIIKQSFHSFDDHALLADGPPMDISSTLVRQHVREERSLRYLVPDSVREYIDVKNLYS